MNFLCIPIQLQFNPRRAIKIYQKMDFQRLSEILPKPSVTWTTDDIQTWLNFIGLSSYIDSFKNSSVDGSCLSQLTEEDLKSQLQIQSKIIRRKIMTWIKEGIHNYDSFLQKITINSRSNILFSSTTSVMRGGTVDTSSAKSNKQKQRKREGPRQMDNFQRSQLKRQSQMKQQDFQNFQQKRLYKNNQYLLSEQIKRQQSDRKIQQQLDFLEQNKSSSKYRSNIMIPAPKRQTLNQNREKYNKSNEINQLRIKQCQASISCCFSLKQHGGMIGRNSKNQIHILDQSISRFHAQIQYENGNYYLRDFGSSSGTFIRITQKTALQNMQIIEMGSNQFLVDLSNYKTLKLTIIQGPNIETQFVLNYAKTKVNFGRKTTNEISFPDDQHLSNIHATIFAVQGVWYIQDIGTTNGTWIRLSGQGIKSSRYRLQNQTQFKLGSSLTYECSLSGSHRKTQKEKSEKCCICKVSEKDCIFLPCKHNVICYKCCVSQQMDSCLICGSAIVESMKIFKV